MRGEQPQPFIDSFMDELATLEGTDPHSALESGADVLPYGVTDTLGLTKEGGETDKEFATRVVEVHLDEVVKSVGEHKWKELPSEVQEAVLDLKYNMGVGSGLKSAIKKSSQDVEAIMEQTLDTAGSTTPDGKKVSVPGLAKRRAVKWNKVFPDKQIRRVDMVREGGKTVVMYVGDNEEVIFSYKTPRPISKDFKTLTETATIEVE